MATQLKIGDLQKQIVELQRELLRLTGRDVRAADPGVQADAVPFGSDRHAAMLGLKKATADDTLQVDGWTLADIISHGSTATPMFLEQFLRQKVSELTTPMPKLQSRDPRESFFAPVMWRPGQSLSQMTE